MSRKRKFFFGFVLILLCAVGVVFRTELVLFFDKAQSPKYPSRYFTAEREMALGNMSKLILKSEGISEVRVSFFAGIFPQIQISGAINEETKTQVVRVLCNNHFEHLHVDHNMRVVRYGFYSNRVWYYYFYGDNGILAARKCKPETVKQLGDQWVFGKW